MRNLFVFFFIFLLFIGNFASSQPGWQWGSRNSGRGGLSSCAAAVDSFGNIYVAGVTPSGVYYANDSMVFGTHIVHNSTTFEQLVITKSDTSGQYLWAIGAHDSNAVVYGIAVNPEGDIYVVGEYMKGSFSFGTVVLTNPNPYYSMLFIAKISTNGNVLWMNNIFNDIGGTGPAYRGIGVDNEGNAYISGSFFESTWLGGTLLVNHDASGITSDIFLVKYSSNGLWRWSKSFGGDYEDYPVIMNSSWTGEDYSNNIMSVTPSGNIYLNGNFYSDSITIGNTTLYNPSGGLTEPGPTYSYVCKWDSSGNVIWAKYVERKIGVNEISSDKNENIYLAGTVDSTVTWGTSTLNYGTLVAKLDSQGNILWAKSASNGDAKSVGVDKGGNVFIAGSMYQSMNISGDTLYDGHAIAMPAMFVVEYDSVGNYLRSLSLADGAGTFCSVRPDKFGRFYLVGNYSDTTLVFGPDILDTSGILWETTFIGRYTYDPPLSVSRLILEAPNNIFIFPNPCDGQLIIKTAEKLHSVEITDINGRCVLFQICDGLQVAIDVSKLAMGNYFLTINGEVVRKFVRE